MPIKHAIWKVGKPAQELVEVSLATEQILEDMIVSDPRILSDEWMIIGRQEDTGRGGRIDLLGMAPDGTLMLIDADATIMRRKLEDIYGKE
jgi:RecB family endonuclease NucS